MKNKTLWYISKYANISKHGADTRQSYFSHEFSKKGHDVTLLLSNSSHLYPSLPRFRGLFKEETHNGFKVVWVNTLKYNHPGSLKRILSWFHFEAMILIYALKNRKQKPDVVVASSLSLLSAITGVFLKKLYKSFFIFEVRDIWPQSLVELKGLSNTHPFIRFLSWVEKIGYEYADVIVGTMGRLNVHVKKRIGGDEKVACIPHGVSLEFYENEQVTIDPQYITSHFSPLKPNIVYAGSFNQAYKLTRFLNLAKNAKGKLDAQFILIGDGPELAKLQNLSRDIENVSIAPKVSRASLNSVLQHADILFHSFDDKPVFMYGVSPNKFIDYMYAGKPTVCLGKVFCPMLEESGAGIVINPDDEEQFYQNVNEYLSLSSQEKSDLAIHSKQYIVNQLSYGKLAEKYCALFDG